MMSICEFIFAMLGCNFEGCARIGFCIILIFFFVAVQTVLFCFFFLTLSSRVFEDLIFARMCTKSHGRERLFLVVVPVSFSGTACKNISQAGA